MDNPIEPTVKQIEACEGGGWEYIEDGLFMKHDWLGYFTETGWHKEQSEALEWNQANSGR